MRRLTDSRRRFQVPDFSSPAAQQRFITSFSEYVYAVVDEASDCAKGNIRSIEEYLKPTRLAGGGYPSFVAVEAGLNIPNEVTAHRPSKCSVLGHRVSHSYKNSYPSLL